MKKYFNLLLVIVFLGCNTNTIFKINKNDVAKWNENTIQKIEECIVNDKNNNIHFFTLNRILERNIRYKVLEKINIDNDFIEVFEVYENKEWNYVSIIINKKIHNFKYNLVNNVISELPKESNSALTLNILNQFLEENKDSSTIDCEEINNQYSNLIIYSKLKNDGESFILEKLNIN